MKSTSMAEARVAFLLLSASGMAMITAGIFLASAGEAPKAPLEEWVAPARAARKQNPAPADAKSVAQGRELYVAGCLPCHGPAGKGDGSAAATLERDGKPIRPGNLSDSKLWQQGDGTLFWKISEGKSPMPAFQESFSEEQRWQIVNYVRTLAPKEASRQPTPKTGGNP